MTSANGQVGIAAGKELPTPVVTAGSACKPESQHWYATYICVRHEQRVAQQLQERRIECFLPTYRSIRRWKDRKKELELPLFPGYVFVHIDLRERLRVLQLPGVVRFLGFNGEPAPLSQNDLQILNRALAQGIHAEPHPYLKVGRKVRIRCGPLAGLQGILSRKKDNFRLVLSVDLIIRSLCVEADEADVDAC